MKSKAGLLHSHWHRYHMDISLSNLLQSWNINMFTFEAALTLTDLTVIIFPFPQTVIVHIKLQFNSYYRHIARYCFL